MRKNVKAIFEAKIDFNKEFKENYGELSSGRRYYFPRQNQKEEKTSYEDIKHFLSDTIEEDLKKHLIKTTGIKITEIRVTGEYNGSIELVFVILFNAYQFIAGMKDFYDNIRMIRNHSRKFIYRKLIEKYGDAFTVETNIEYPSIDRYEDLFWLSQKRGLPFSFHQDNENKRDGLFYYLLISNIVLISIIGLLVFKAVKHFYGF